MEYYSVLMLDSSLRYSITENDITKQYRRLARIYHPDKCKAGSEKFLDISLAYEVLSNPIKKRIYDNSLDTDKVPYFNFSDILFKKLGKLISPNITWKKDIILSVKKCKLGTKQTVKYKRHNYKVEGILIHFYISEEIIDIILPEDHNYSEELYTIPSKGNYIIENNQLICGDLDLDVQIE